MAEPATLYKLIILHMLEHIDFPLSNAQISDFFLDREYTDYFTIQQVIHDLMDSGLVRTENTHNSTRYIITPAGKETLHFFHDKISPSIEEDIAAYFQANKLAIKTENAYLSDYYKTPEQEYGVRCQLREKGRTRLDFTLTVQTKEQAEAICTNWQNQADDVIACLMDLLLK